MRNGPAITRGQIDRGHLAQAFFGYQQPAIRCHRQTAGAARAANDSSAVVAPAVGAIKAVTANAAATNKPARRLQSCARQFRSEAPGMTFPLGYYARPRVRKAEKSLADLL
jgi:hypothetical protein